MLLIIPALLFTVPAHAAPETSPVFAQLKDNTQTPKERAQTIEKIKNLKEVTGLEWFQMSVEEKQSQIMASMYRLERTGMTFERTVSEYSYRIQKKLYADPSLYEVTVTELLASVVHEKEGESHGQNIR